MNAPMTAHTVSIRPLAPTDCRLELTALLHKAYASSWYTRADTAILSQFAVDPQCQGQGLGARLMQAAETWAGVQGMAHVALDTAKPAEHLQRRYVASGYVPMCEIQSEGKTYASVLMVKTLAARSAQRS